MARITKAQLEQQVADMAAQIEHLKATLEHAVEALAHAEQDLVRMREQRPVQRTQYQQPAWQAERAAAMAAAKAGAMRMGRSVRVVLN